MRRTNLTLSRILHHEWISRGKIVQSNETKHTVLFLHGLLGSGKNLRTVAKRFTQNHPQLSALVMDARGHGSSTNFQNQNYNFSAPHTMKNCAIDVIETLKHLDLTAKTGEKDDNRSPIGIIGHSFGARIALEYVHTLACANESKSDNLHTIISPPLQTWLLDSVPGEAHSSVADVVHAVASVPLPIESKKHLVEELTKNKRVDPAIASWMTTNLIPSKNASGAFQFAFDLNIVLSILQNFPTQEFYQRLKDIEKVHATTYNEGKALKVNLVRALLNDSWTPSILAKLESFDQNFLNMHSLNSGHWVHVDDLNGLLDAMHGSFDEL